MALRFAFNDFNRHLEKEMTMSQARVSTDGNAPDFAAIRERFPGAQDKVYMNAAARGLPCVESRASLDAYLDKITDGRLDKAANFDMIERVREKYARLINAESDEIAFTKNVSDGLNMIAASVPLAEGDNVVLCCNLEHPNNIYPWLNLGRTKGVEIRDIADRDGFIDVDSIIAAMDDRTRLVTVATVTFAPGFRTDVAKLGQACRARGVFLLVDGVQSVGIVATDVKALKVDALAVSTQKALLGLYGMGFIYCRREWAEKITPAALARFSVDLGAGTHEATMGGDSYDLMPGARRFDLGNYNFPAAAMVEPALDLLLAVGPEAIESYVCGLSHRLAAGLHQLGLPVSGGPPGPHLAHIITAGQYTQDTHDGAGDAATDALYHYLTENNVVLTVRRGMLRFALHIYNTEEDVDRVLDLVRGWQDAQKAA